MAEMTEQEKRDAVALAWSHYRAESQAIPALPWNEFIALDEAAWRRYVACERDILGAKARVA